MSLRTKPRAAMVHTRRFLHPARTYVDWISSRRDGADLSVFHEYVPPPSGGGHQFIGALTERFGHFSGPVLHLVVLISVKTSMAGGRG